MRSKPIPERRAALRARLDSGATRQGAGGALPFGIADRAAYRRPRLAARDRARVRGRPETNDFGVPTGRRIYRSRDFP
ncbi:hypothetical protein [uncultured Methylobacterium sp.]|uniref:hypothetical protein n=1 Tax=uncultured Methylobacterium sp. TaxID=157278 RepID=UPI0035CA83C8